MRTLFRLLLWLSGGAILIAVLGVAFSYYLVSRSATDFDAALEVEGINEPVEIVRDASAVPHIFAKTRGDAFFALGLVHAQDRLWQMEMTRRGAQGRLSELLGEGALPIDRKMRILGLYGHARAAVSRQSGETQAALRAYADGVNAWIREVNEKALGRGAPEFFLFDEGLSPWTPADSLAVLKVMALRMTDAAERETQSAKLLRRLSPEKLRDILPDYPDQGILALPAFESADLGKGPSKPGTRTGRTAKPADPVIEALNTLFFPPLNFGGASNAWAVDGSRSATGAPLMANDPHLSLSAPSIWHLAHIEAPGMAVIGAAIPGAPAIILGRNRSIAWGLTIAGADDQDIYIEKVNPENPNEYLTPGGWMPFDTRTERIGIRGGGEEMITLRTTRHGPVLSADIYNAGAATPEGHVAALAWTALSAEDESMRALLNVMRATTLDEAVEAGRHVLAPAANVIVTSAEEVGAFVTGRMPLRQPGSRSKGRLPSLGWIAANDWNGLTRYEDNPRSLRPQSGIIANANNRTTNAAFPAHITYDWAPPYRIRRLEQKLNAREFHTAESFVELQNDTVSEMARAVLPLIARDLWWTREEGGTDARSIMRDEALDILGDWNGDMSEHAAEPLIFAAWMRALTNRIAGDELGPLIKDIEGSHPLFVERVFYNIDGAGVWCDVDKTVRVETCGEIARLALDDALAELSAIWGREIRAWRWGEAHLARHVATPLGLSWPGSLLLNIEHESSGGDYTLNRAKTPGRGPDPYQNRHAAGFRAVYDFADLDRSIFIISTGQSGHFLSRHYDDMSERWRLGEYIPMSMREEDARAGARGVTTLSPAGAAEE